MFGKVLVANRGEIAVRIIRALREMNITSVAVYSEADRNAMHAELADEAVCIGPAKTLDSYANPIAILSAAMVTGCEAIHPGYGFLSERSDFAALCEDVGISFIGPSSYHIRSMGNKHNARVTMIEAGVPVIPGSDDLVLDIEEARQVAERIGFPLMIKAADGGGGKGMRRVDVPEELEDKFMQAQAETQAIYGNQHLYIEQIIQSAKHIEVQLLGDTHGNVIHLGERDCSLQRNNQKVIEFAPALSLAPETREGICKAAVRAAKAIEYTNAGTIEFLVDQAGNYYFMEMNTRLQVEHPVTEMITGVDLVQEQIRIASGEALSYRQEDIQFSGFAIECRLNAENPRANFMPSSGHINRCIMPAGGLGLRVETAAYSEYELPPFYDSMIGKIITHHDQREGAFQMMKRALYEVVVEGLETNVDLLDALIGNETVFADAFDTRWLESQFMPAWNAMLEAEEG